MDTPLLFPGRSVASLTDVSLGHWAAASGSTGSTVILPAPGTTAGVDVRGGGPAVHESAILAPGTLSYGADAILLTGGSAFGLAAARGVQDVLAESGVGSPVPGGITVPIVPAAAIFDLGRAATPTEPPGLAAGAAAARAALTARRTTAGDTTVLGEAGSVGAGLGAWCDRGLYRGGLGHALITLGEVQVAALVVANPSGGLLDARGELNAAGVLADFGIGLPRLTGTERAALAAERERRQRSAPADSPRNTTIACIVTNARLDTAEATRLAATAHAGLARAVRPSHTLFDGDTVFALACGTQELPEDSPRDLALTALGAAGADALSTAIVDAVLRVPAAGAVTDPTAPRPLASFAPDLAAAWAGLRN
ncbi:P1 family peptidase [Brevibacterium sp. 50QC2O2]|uniref:P1 family peptidase n=1 Tax=Brevibacterium sp. 50QC2O2 TaxID=2968459 RepID=UPI00211CA61B|nr:P1 family peptidase [Brevibacterium sp. 50QC2O2]MCQ9387517.1 P1 family peptidase [Brevibacterium sp. 50QC2O2]